MNKILKGVIAGSLLMVGAANASAGTILFTQCWSSCANIGGTDNTAISDSVASLFFEDNGSGGVDFTLTNTFGNLFPGDTTAFLANLRFNATKAPTTIINLSSNVDSIVYDADGIDAAVAFDLFADFENSGGPGNLRINDGEFATWTFTGFAESDVLLPAMVHIQGLPNGGSVKITDGGTIIEEPFPVPEPGMLMLLGSALMGLALGRKRKAKA